MTINTQKISSPVQVSYEIEKKISPIKRWSKLLLKSRTGLAGLIIVLLVILLAIFAPAISPHDPAKVNSANILKPPFWMEGGSLEFILGTDNLGRDVLSRIIYGSRVSLLVGICAVIVSGAIGAFLGIISGFLGGWVDALIMRITDAFLALPSILIMLVLIGVFGPSLTTLILVMGFTDWVSYTRLVRGEVLSLKERDFIRAAHSIGTKKSSIMTKHLLPNVFSTFIVISTLNVASAIISESSLSFLGLGIQPPTVSWGYMLSEGQAYLSTSWWIATFPGIAITITVIGITFLGDWLRDVMDPFQQGGRS
ncbi:ABC transporter permease [Niallia nealsonii]|uniref:Peptide ABC transporter permease n=1 Tax=Niallia nealsonii TaxID=115979 RepID=A0A2N0Z762_9BACI|nr:ABC transporter permease [Niallia nealsonii]PKG25340.1 peptide ABC transporter permease [Niallia nealsonii]